MIRVCAWCNPPRVEDRDSGEWVEVPIPEGATVTHGICQDHAAELDAQADALLGKESD